MNGMQIMTNIVMFFTLVFFLYTNSRTFLSVENPNKLKMVFIYTFNIVPYLCIAFFNIALPIFYFVMYAISYVSICELYEQKKGKWLLVNTYFLAFATSHLITLGTIALFTNMSIPELLDVAVLRSITLAITLGIEIVINSIIWSYFNKNAVHLLALDLEEFQLFSSYVWFCTIFVMLDSILCLIELPIFLTGIFMIGSNLLLFLMLYLFMSHIYMIAHNSYVKEELAYMKMEEAKQHDRTKKWEERAYLDTLTGAYTRIYAISNITAMLQNKEAFAIVFLDLDGLKKINDEQGHMQGDLYLKKFVEHMKTYLRPNDVLARIGGDEFLVIMSELSKQQAVQIISKCRDEGEEILFSFGVVAVPMNTEIGAEEWIAQADHYMYEDKQRHKRKEGD